jgi:hypothetical protein
VNQRDEELNELLRTVRVPERSPEYWAEFPEAVVRQLQRSAQRPAAPLARHAGWAWGLGIATACLLLGFFVGFRRGHAVGFSTAEVAQSQKIYHELAALFPDRVQTVLLDGRGSQLTLATDAQPPASAPLLVQISHAGVCRRFITFSGQRVALNGETFEVLADAQGNVLVVGQHLAWSSDAPRLVTSGYRIRATALGERL